MNQLLTIVVLCAFSCLACNKNNDNGNKAQCLVTQITQPGGDKYLLNYDEKGRLISVDYGTSSVSNISYESNKIIELTTGTNGYYNKKTFTLNASGLVTQEKTEYNAAGTSWQLRNYVYQGTQVTKMIMTESNSSSSERTYTWANGNLITENIVGAGHSQKIEHEYYTDRVYQPGLNATNSIDILKTQHLLKKRTSNSQDNSGTSQEITSFTYEFDKDGNISAITEKDEINTTRPGWKYSFDYKCK